MGNKKNITVGVRVTESDKELLSNIAEKEIRSISQQAEYFIKRGIEEYLEINPDFKNKNKKRPKQG